MRKLTQTRLHVPGKVKGNCFPTVIACFMDLESPEDAFQIQEHYNDEDGWVDKLIRWLFERDWEWGNLNGHQYDDSHYLVIGNTNRSKTVKHVCIYRNGKLWHDPHPDGTGLTTETNFEYLIKNQ